MTKRVLYMVWVRVDKLIEDDWGRWMDEVHIPNLVNADGFVAGHKYMVQHDAAGITYNYVTIYEIESMEAFESYKYSDYADKMRQEVSDRFGDQVMSARTVLTEE